MDKHLRLALMISDALDNKFKIAGFKFGIDPLLGLIPGFGDLVGLILSFYLIWIGLQMKLPEDKIQRMVMNVVFDFVIGLFPVVGDLVDFIFKANVKNAEILRAHAQEASIEGQIVH